MIRPFDLQSWLRERRERVEGLLSHRLEAIRADTPERLWEAMRYSLLDGGKRLRPIFCLAFAEAVSGGRSPAARMVEDAACALEYVHTYSLIHDDLPAMDDGDLRRGRPTSHKVFGEAMAILAGDALLTEAFALAAAGPETERAKVTLELAGAAGATGMVGGQVLDISEDRRADLDFLARMHRMKTGALIRAACRVGAIAGGGGEHAVAAAGAYGEAVGLAFQIADDLLDVTASAEQMGKRTGADAAAGRRTYPAVVGLERARELAEAEVLRAIVAIEGIESSSGPLASLARYAVERRS